MMNGTWKVDARDGKLAMAHIYVAFVALALGGLAGLLQVLVRSGKFELPAGISYYTILTTHGVLLGLVLTTFFIIGFQFAAVSRTAGTLSDRVRFWGWIGFWLMTIGTAITAFYILIGEASVLYTFYAPLQAHAGFYIGLTLVVVGSWISGFAMFAHYAKWKKLILVK
ncbi:cytochrome c oxidase subunit 1 [Anoxybacillus sp. BCO1]|nr:cytochrome c oxidase subunit 1 [Anoxybacillus sp. BCO1]